MKRVWIAIVLVACCDAKGVRPPRLYPDEKNEQNRTSSKICFKVLKKKGDSRKEAF